MSFLWFLIGAVVGVLLLGALPLVVAVFGAMLAIGLLIALPLLFAILILVGVLAAAPALGYGLLFAVVLIALWASDRRRPRRLPPR
jgi:hypothetical protein